jgi:phage terminase large subunit
LFLFAGIRGQSIENLKSYEGVDVCWVEEANAVTKKSWSVLIPTIRKEASEIWISFNPDLDTDETYVRFVQKPPKDSIVIQMNWRDNPWFPEVLAKEKDHLEAIDPVAFKNVWEGECRSAVDGAIYATEIGKLISDGRYRPVPYDPMLSVHTIWDLGWNDKMAIILVQGLAGELRIIQYIEDSHLTLADYVNGLNANKYRWGVDWLPHDGAAKDYKTGKSAEEILRELGRNPRIVPQIGIEQGIKATRLIFPRLYVDSDNASRLIDCCKRYRRAIPTSTNEPAAPLHDEYSHGADALRYLAVMANEIRNEATSFKKLIYPKRVGL